MVSSDSKVAVYKKASAIAGILLLMLSLINKPSFAQNSEFLFKKLSINDGLSHATAHHIMQDRNGFIWVSTRDGLNKYDGQKFKKFEHKPEDTNSLSANSIWLTYEDSDGLIWIGTNGGGLNVYDQESRQFYRFVDDSESPNSISNNTVISIFEDRDGTMWIGTDGGGLNRVVQKDRSGDDLILAFERLAVTRNPQSLYSGTIMDIAQDDGGMLWIATYGDGIYQYDIEEGKTYPQPEIGGSYVMSLALNGSQLWAGTKYNGLSLLNLKTSELTVFKHDTLNQNSLSSNFVWPLYIDSRENIWVGTFGGGLNRISKQKGSVGPKYSITSYQKGVKADGQIPDNYISSIYGDQSGLVWLATDNSGIALFRTASHFTNPDWEIVNSGSDLSDLTINDFFIDKQNNRWIGTASGLLLQPAGQTGFEFVESWESSKIVNTITQIHNNVLLIGTNAGLYLKSGEKSPPRHLRISKSDEAAAVDRIYDIVQDDNNYIWLSTNAGLWKLNKEFNVIERYHQSSIPSLNSSNTGKLYLEKDTLWIATSNSGLNKLNLESGKITHYSYSAGDASIGSNKVSDILRDGSGNLWIATFGGGLNKLNYRSDEAFFENYTDQQGLPDNTVKSLALDKFGNLWVVTQSGLARVDLQSESIFPITIPVTHSNRDLRDLFLLNKEKYIVTASKGLRVFNPIDFLGNTRGAQLSLTSLQFNGEDYQSKNDITNLSEVRLNHDENFLRFEFALLDFYSSDFANYSYKMDEIDRDWIRAGRTNFASYSALEPDDYTFRVKAIGYNGIPARNELAISVSILAPFWQRWWFQIGVLCLISLLLRAAYNYRVQSLLKMERTRRRIAGDLHDDISSTLSSITYFAKALGINYPELTGSKHLNLIVESSTEAKEKISDIVWSIDPDHDEWVDLLSRCRRFASDLLESKNISYQLNITEHIELPKNPVLRKELWLIFKEMVTNVVRHSEADNVEIAICYQNNKLRVTVEDDGVGILEEELGFGNGIRNIKRRAQAISADISLDSHPNKGTKWIFELNSRHKNFISWKPQYWLRNGK